MNNHESFRECLRRNFGNCFTYEKRHSGNVEITLSLYQRMKNVKFRDKFSLDLLFM